MGEFTSELARELPPEQRASRQGALDKVDAALRQNLLKWHLLPLEKKFSGSRVDLEIGQIDTEEKPNPTGPYFINLTGTWGRGPECESEVKALAFALGKQGMRMDNISLPNHGHSSELPGGWGNTINDKSDFDRVAEIVAEYIGEYIKNDPEPNPLLTNKERKVILTAWSMGGVTALKIAALYPDLISGVVLMETPVFPQNFRDLATRFFTYGVFHKGVKPEPPPPTSFTLPGLNIFWERIKNRNKIGGMKTAMVIQTAKSLSEQDLQEDRTLHSVAVNNIPILLLHGQNDFVVPQQQMLDLEKNIISQRGNIERQQIPGAGHALPAEKPREVGRRINFWLNKHHLLTP